MSATTLTIISGVLLFVVFGLVGWSMQRRRKTKALQACCAQEEIEAGRKQEQ